MLLDGILGWEPIPLILHSWTAQHVRVSYHEECHRKAGQLGACVPGVASVRGIDWHQNLFHVRLSGFHMEMNSSASRMVSEVIIWLFLPNCETYKMLPHLIIFRCVSPSSKSDRPKPSVSTFISSLISPTVRKGTSELVGTWEYVDGGSVKLSSPRLGWARFHIVKHNVSAENPRHAMTIDH